MGKILELTKAVNAAMADVKIATNRKETAERRCNEVANSFNELASKLRAAEVRLANSTDPECPDFIVDNEQLQAIAEEIDKLRASHDQAQKSGQPARSELGTATVELQRCVAAHRAALLKLHAALGIDKAQEIGNAGQSPSAS